MKLYEFLYCSCVFESGYRTISVHKTKRGAYKAMNKWLNDKYWKEWDLRMKLGKEKPFLYKDDNGIQRYILPAWRCFIYQAWTVKEIELFE